MRTVYKYEVTIDDDFTIELPQGAEILTVQAQYGTPQMWALVDTAKPKEKRTFILRGTGHRIDSSLKLDYINTFQSLEGRLVFHLFEVLKPEIVPL